MYVCVLFGHNIDKGDLSGAKIHTFKPLAQPVRLRLMFVLSPDAKNINVLSELALRGNNCIRFLAN